MKKPLGKLSKVSGDHSSVDPKKHYDNWAEEYDHELINDYGYIAHKITTSKFRTIVTYKKAQIIDVGCGTGLVGKELKKLGYSNIEGYDISPKMLKKAQKTNAYQGLFELDLNQKKTIGLKRYDALISVGSFGYGSLNIKSLLNLIRLVNSKGVMFIFMNSQPFFSENYEEYLSLLVKKGFWKIYSISAHNYMTELKRPGKLIIAIKR